MPGAAPVSAREAEVLALLGEQLTYAEIGQRLFISARTVESHVISLRQKLGASDRRELARLARASATGRARSGRLPTPLTTFVGRETERADLRAALTAARLVTVAGPGGVGKTRLALAVAADIAAEGEVDVTYVDLVPLIDGAAAAAAVVAARGIAEWSGRAAEDAIAEAIGDRPTLLVLDNCEHVVDGVVQLVEQLLERCAGLRVLLTSRVRLVVPFEHVYELGGLAEDTDAVALFLARSGLPDDAPQRPAVVRICAALGGIALAIELAAARASGLGIDGLEVALSEQLPLLVGGPRVSERHRSVRQMLQWSTERLSPEVQAVLRRVTAFATPFTAAAASAVTGYAPLQAPDVPPALATLCEHSLLTARSTASGTRYRMLEPVRQFAMLELGEDLQTVRAAHLRWCAGVAASLVGARDRDASWCDAVDDIADELRTARDAPSDVIDDERSQLARQTAHLLFLRGRLRDAQVAYERAAALREPGVTRALLLADAAAVAKCRVLGEESVRLDEAAATELEAAGDDVGAARVWARRAEHMSRFVGMYDRTLSADDALAALERARALAGADTVAAAAILAAQAYLDNPVDGPVLLASAERACEAAAACGDPLVLSSALDALCAACVDAGDYAGAGRAATRRIAPLLTLADAPIAALELKDALHSAMFFLLGAGDVSGALAAARRHETLPFLRGEGDLGAEDLFPPLALSGQWDDAALATAEGYRAAWIRSGSPRATGRSMTPAAVALIYDLRRDDAARDAWRSVAAAMRGCSFDEAMRSGDARIYAAIGLLDRQDPAGALAVLDRDAVSGLVTDRVLGQWRQALAAEAAVLAATADAPDRVRAAPASDPTVPGAIARRAAALLARDVDAVAGCARTFADLACPYQEERTRHLASRIAT